MPANTHLRLRFGRLSGDSNPIHYGKFYAHAFSFEGYCEPNRKPSICASFGVPD